MATEKELSGRLAELRKKQQNADPWAQNYIKKLGRDISKVQKQLKQLSAQKDSFAMYE